MGCTGKQQKIKPITWYLLLEEMEEIDQEIKDEQKKAEKRLSRKKTKV